MSVRTFPTVLLPEMFGVVVDMPLPDLYVVQTSKGEYTFHADEIREIFYNQGVDMPVGTYVYYNNMNGTIDPVIGIVIEVDSEGMLKIEWFDGFADWYGPCAIIKV